MMIRKIANNDGTQTILHYYGPWDILHKVTNVRCSDGKDRTAIIIGEADTVWTIPAYVRVNGKTIRGYLHSSSGDDTDRNYREWVFSPSRWLKNGGLLPEWTIGYHDASFVYCLDCHVETGSPSVHSIDSQTIELGSITCDSCNAPLTGFRNGGNR